MPISGAQDFWVAGSRLYFQRDPVDSVLQPTIDLGVIQSANPSFEIETLKLEDSDGGIKSTVAETTVKIDETYEITCSNFNMDNMALLFAAAAPEDFEQAATQILSTHWAIAERLLKLKDTDDVSIYGITSVDAVSIVDGVNASVEVIASQVVSILGDATSEIADEDTIYLYGLTVPADDGVYTVVGSPVFNTPNTDITVTEIITDQVASGGDCLGALLVEDTDWETVSLERGLIRMLPDGDMDTDGDVIIAFTPRLITGARLIKPQTVKGEVEGQIALIWGRGNNDQQSVRECKVSVTPSSSNIQVDDFSDMVLNFTVLSDLTAADPAGRLIYFKGDEPTKS